MRTVCGPVADAYRLYPGFFPAFLESRSDHADATQGLYPNRMQFFLSAHERAGLCNSGDKGWPIG